jgi:hypothetical protein
MKEPPQHRRARAESARQGGDTDAAEGSVPASGSEGARDARPGRGGAPAPDSAPPAPDAAADPVGGEEALALPDGAWLAMRKSGGLLFSSREVVVYGDGRVTGSAIGGGRPQRDAPPRRLPPAQLAALHRAVEQIDFDRLPAAGGQSRDAFVYELVARRGQTTYAADVFEGAIPEQLAPLIEQLNRLLPRDEA